MAGRELSSTLKNLKFMQRATKKEENAKQAENLKPEAGFLATSSPAPDRRCVVIIEGDPHPGAARGRMSFQSFNPSIDKLNEEATNTSEKQASSTISNQNGGIFERGGATAVETRASASHNSSINVSDIELKRKQPEERTSIRSSQKLKVTNSSNEQPSSGNNSKGLFKQPPHGKFDWNVLRPPKPYKD